MTPSDQQPLVFVVDDDPDILAALALMFKQEHIQVETYENAEAFLANLSAHDSTALLKQDSCIILDVRLPGMDGLQLQETLHRENVALPIVFLTGHGDIPMSVEAMKAGAENFLTKPVTREKLMASVRAALHKCADWHNQMGHRAEARKRLNNLTSRELEILAMTIDGLPNKVIARRLDISLRTVEHHKTNILNKTETGSSIELSRLAHDSGMTFV